MKKSTIVVLCILAAVVIAALVAVIIVAEKNGLTVGAQISDWWTQLFGNNEPVVEETVEQVTEAVALVA